MDLGFSEQQEMLRKMARDFLTAQCPKRLVRDMEDDGVGYPQELWQKMAELGWHGLAFPENYGGGGGTFLDLMVLLEEMGRACLPGPFFSTAVLGGLSILDLGDEEQKREFLPQIARGTVIMTLALQEADAKYAPSSINTSAVPNRQGYSYTINGSKLFVPYAHLSDWMLCVARTRNGGTSLEKSIHLFLVNTKSLGVSYDLLTTIANDRQCEVRFHNVIVPKQYVLRSGWNGVAQILQKAAVAKCIEMVGQAQQVLEMSVEYAKTRIQFGRPIGSFQAIQHHCANMAVDVESARLMAYRAAWQISEGVPCAREASAAKVWVNEACKRVMALGHQIHGAIGFTWDHDMQLFSRRAVTGRTSFGDSDFHRDQVGLAL